MTRLTAYLTAAICALVPVTATAQDVLDCDWQSSAQNLFEPWADYTRTFSNGKTRVALLDVGEPAAAAIYFLILSPPYDELGFRQCKVVGYQGAGFGWLHFEHMRTNYDPARGLTFSLPGEFHDSATANMVTREVEITLNQATGAITTRVSR